MNLQVNSDTVNPPIAHTSACVPLWVMKMMGGFVIVGSMTTLMGWMLDMPKLTAWNKSGISMFPNPAVCAVLSGIALLLLSSRFRSTLNVAIAVRILGGMVAAVGVLTLFEHVTLISLGIDTFLIYRPWGQGAASAPMRMGLPATVSFTCIGSALCLLATSRNRTKKFASILGTFVVCVAMLSLLGYLYGAKSLYAIPRFTGVSFQTAIMVASIGVGLIAAVPEFGITGLLRRQDAGGTMMRRLFLPIIVSALALGWLRVRGQEAGLYDTGFGTAARTLVEMVLFLTLLWWTANDVSNSEQAASEARKTRAKAQAALEQQREQLLATERLARSEAEQAGRMKDEFLATLSHELRTPLNAILGWSQLLTHKRADVKTIMEGIGIIERNARAQSQLIEDLLDMSRIISGKIRLEVQRVELSDVIDAAMAVVHPSADAKSIRLAKVIEPQSALITGDPNRLQQVLWNLLSNAIKFSEKESQVTVTVRRVQSHVEMTVADTGQGIEPEFLPYVFERFRQQDASTTRRHGGLGLGLAIVKQLVELHGGHVSVRSDGIGKGTAFVVELPLTAVRQSDQESTNRRYLPDIGTVAAGLPDISGLRILLVDDEPDAVSLVSRLLEDSGVVVTRAVSVREALDLFKASKPDVIISDIGMPDEDGYDLIRAVRDHEHQTAATQTPAVALTAFARSEDRLRALNAGYQMHIAKPVEPAELITVVASVAQKL